MDVLRLLVEGRSAPEIGDILSISPRTVTTHISNILGKLDVETRAAAVAVALRSGLVQPGVIADGD
jgi:DNA-binding CsgD family transcriptional regulator